MSLSASRWARTVILSVAICVVPATQVLNAQSRESGSRYGSEEEAEAASSSVILTRRVNNGPYGTSAYSFVNASHDVDVHRNYVDLVFNGCGLLHVNPVGGMNSQIADLGPAGLDVDVDETADIEWGDQAFLPQEGHVYMHEIRGVGRTMTVKFRVDEVSRDQIAISWAMIREPSEKALTGMAGTMGQCGGNHAAR